MKKQRRWVEALKVIPRISHEEWQQLDVITKWLVATRAAVIIMTVTAAVIAGLLAYKEDAFCWWRFLLVVFGLFFAHATNNMVNDYTDYKKGIDKDNYYRTQYGPQPIQQGLWSAKTLFKYIVVTGLLAVACGIPLVWHDIAVNHSYRTLWLMLAGVIFVLFYTWPLKYIGLGELTVLIIWGPLMIGGGFYAITGMWDWNTVWASLPYGLAATAVIFGKHIDKAQQDREKGVRTLPVIIGEKTSRILLVLMFVAEYAIIIYLVVTGYFSPILLTVLLSAYFLITPLKMLSKPRPKTKPEQYDVNIWPLWFVAAAFYHTRIFGIFYLAAILLDTVFFS